MADTENVQLSILDENQLEEQDRAASEAVQNDDREETQNNCMKRLRSSWHAVLIGVLMVLLCVVTSNLFIQMQKEQRLTAEYQHMAEELQIENSHLIQVLNSTRQNSSELSAEKTKLSLLLKSTSHEKTQGGEEKKESATLSHTCNLVEAENGQLHLHLDAARHIIGLASAEGERWCQMLDSERQTTMQLEELNKRQKSILFSSKLSFIWRFCNRNTLQCSRCLPGWVEHMSHCFFLSKEPKKWEKACRQCLDTGADMAEVLNAEDQTFLTNMTFQFVQQHPEEGFHSAWIGLQDMMMEGNFFWVTGQRIHPDVTYWMSGEPNNAMASWDNSRAGQDCVAIVPPTSTEKQDWLTSWDDIICADERHYLCETTALSVT